MKNKNKYYVVWVGHVPGVYQTWPQAASQIKNFPDAKFKSADTLEQAVFMFQRNWRDYIDPSGPGKISNQPIELNLPPDFKHGIAVDASSIGNPGIMEYRGVETESRIEIFNSIKYPIGTNNIGEFLAIVHALALYAKAEPHYIIYTDSLTAISWVRQKKCKTKLPVTRATQKLFEVVARAELWLKTNAYKNPITKWETKQWGEIPADFGRK